MKIRGAGSNLFHCWKLGLFLAFIFVCAAAPARAFGPCISAMPSDVSYLPDVAACGHKAAAVLTGKYYNSFSVVLRDCQNGDRDPCHRHAGSCGTNASSPFKVQKIIKASIKDSKGKTKLAQIHCFKERGNVQVYKVVRRITIKLRNPVRTSGDLVRLCLKTRTSPVHNVSIEKIYSARRPVDAGWTKACATQRYVDCKISVQRMCAGYGG